MTHEQTEALAHFERFYPAFQFVIWGGKDPISTVKTQGRPIRNALKDSASLAVISAAGHPPHEEKPEVVNDILREFSSQRDHDYALLNRELDRPQSDDLWFQPPTKH